MIKLYKIMLALTVLIVVVSNILVEAQDFISVFPTTTTSTTPKEPPPKTPPPPPPTPPPPPPKTTDPPPPPPPKTTDPPPPPPPPPPPKTTDPAPPPPPPITTDPLPSSLPPPPPKLPPPPQTTPETPVSTQPLSPLPTPQLCTTSDDCDNTKFCNQGKCQPRGSLGDKCVNRDACLSQLICNKGVCQYRDDGPKNGHNYDVKKAAITGGIIVGVFVVSGFIFFVYRGFKNREGRKGRGELTSSLYSTDGTAEFDPIYPFSERTNSFSNNKPTSPSHVPTTNHYDPLPSNGSGGFVGGPGPRQGYYNYYNNDYNGGGYVMQNENEVTKRTMKLLQQTRGNVMIAPHVPPHAPHAPSHIPHAPHPPHLQQNYNWNYGVPGAPPAQQQLMMNQGVLFPVPSVKRNYGGHIPNNDIKNNVNNKNNNNNSSNSSNVNTGDKQKKTQNLRDLLESNSNSVDSLPSNNSENGNVESIYDTYARESVIKPKTLEVKLSQATNNNDNKDDLSRNTPEKRYNPTIDQSTSKDSKSITGRSRSRTFGHADSSKPLQSKSSTVGQQNESKGLNGINENDEF